MSSGAVPTLLPDGPVSPFDRLLLWLALIQGSSFTLSLALNGPLPVPASTLALLVSALWGLMYMLAALGLFFTFGLDWLTWLLRYRLPLALLVAGALGSSVWSIDPLLSVERGAHLLGTTVVALYLGFRLSPRQILVTTSQALALLLICSALAALLVPSLGLEDYHGRLVWRGVTASKNTLGFWAAVAILLFAVRAVETPSIVSRLSWLGLAALAVGCLVASVSATSSLALVIAALAMLYVHAATELRLGIVPMAVLALLVGGLVSLAVGSIDTAELIGRSGNLTGRIDVWSETWRLILERPLGGYGYGTLWFPTEASVRIQERLMDLSWTVYHAHNGLLQIASEVGMPLAVLTVIVVVQQLIETLWCQYRRPQGATLFVIGFSVALLVSNYAEARLLVNRDLFWIFFVALPISVVRQAELGVPAWPSSSSARWRRGQRSPAERRAALERRRDLKRRLRLKDGSDLPEGIAADAVRPPTERG